MGIVMIPNKNQVMQEESSNEVSHIKQAPGVDCYEASKNGLKGCVVFKYLSNLLISAVSFDRFRHPAVTQRRISKTWLMGGNGALSAFGAAIIALFCFAGASPLAAAPTLHEQLLAADPGLREADEAHSAAYRLLRSILDKGSQQQLKNEQLVWINSLNQTLAQTPAFQRKQVVLQWTLERTQSLKGAYEARTGRVPHMEPPPLPQPFAQNTNVPPEMAPRDGPDESIQAENRKASLLCADISDYWKIEGETARLPECLPNALVDRLEQLVHWAKIDLSGVAKGRHPNLNLAYAVHHALIAKPLDLSSMAELLDQGKNLNLAEVPWVGSFQRILENRRLKAIALQEEALNLMKSGDAQAAESRLVQAVKEYPSASLSAYSAALASYDKLTQDKALRAVDGDWKKPSLPDKELMGKSTEQAAALRAFDGKEVLPALSSLARGLDAAGVLGKFSTDYEPAGNMDQPHPIRALQTMRKSEKYRELKSDESVFPKPFVDRMKFLDELIGPKTKDYEKLVEQGNGLEKESKFLDAATTFRLALAIEFSKELEQIIHRCEAKTSGL